jgi:N-acetylglucosamine repressor
LRSTGSLPLIKEMNRSLILETIRTKSPISRAQIAKHTGLHPSTVTRIVASLLEDGIIEEKGMHDQPKVVGRQPIMLSLVADSMHVVGVAVEITSATGLIVNLHGEVVEREEQIWESTGKDDIVQGIKSIIDRLMEKGRGRGVKILGVGIGMHGMVDHARGVCLYAPAFGWKDAPISDLLSPHYDFPIRVENNANTMALGEYWFGQSNVASLAAVKVGHAIGSGIILNESLFVGEAFSAGEIGHFTVAFDGPLCNCGNHGCLETVASIDAIVRQGRRMLRDGVTSELLHLTGTNLDALDLSHICQGAALGDQLSLQLFADAGSHIGVAVANLINMLNPRKVLIGGEIFAALDFILPKIREVVDVRALAIPRAKVEIEPVGLGRDAVAIGAVTLILRDVFGHPRPGKTME